MSSDYKPLFRWRSAVSSERGPTKSTTRHILLVLSLYMDEKGASCYPSAETLAEATGLSKRCVLEHLHTAESEGWITIEQRTMGGQGWRRNEYEAVVPPNEPEPKRSDAGSPRQPSKGGDPHAEGGDFDAERGDPHAEGGDGASLDVSIELSNDVSKEGAKEGGTPDGDPAPSPAALRLIRAEEEETSSLPEPAWNEQYAEAAYARLSDLDVLARAVRRKDKADVIEAWADEFRLIHEQDGYSPDEIRRVMKWLLRPDCWWIKSGNVRSAGSLRKKNKGGEGRKFDTLFDQMKRDEHKQQESRTDDYADNVARILRVAANA